MTKEAIEMIDYLDELGDQFFSYVSHYEFKKMKEVGVKLDSAELKTAENDPAETIPPEVLREYGMMPEFAKATAKYDLFIMWGRGYDHVSKVREAWENGEIGCMGYVGEDAEDAGDTKHAGDAEGDWNIDRIVSIYGADGKFEGFKVINGVGDIDEEDEDGEDAGDAGDTATGESGQIREGEEADSIIIKDPIEDLSYTVLIISQLQEELRDMNEGRWRRWKNDPRKLQEAKCKDLNHELIALKNVDGEDITGPYIEYYATDTASKNEIRQLKDRDLQLLHFIELGYIELGYKLSIYHDEFLDGMDATEAAEAAADSDANRADTADGDSADYDLDAFRKEKTGGSLSPFMHINDDLILRIAASDKYSSNSDGYADVLGVDKKEFKELIDVVRDKYMK